MSQTAPKVLTATNDSIPHVSMILPFEPVMSARTTLERMIRRAIEQVRYALLSVFSQERVLPLLVRLQHLAEGLNYHTHKKGIAIFVSPVCEKVDYLGFQVEEKISVDNHFTIRDILGCRKHPVEYLVLLFIEGGSRMYLGKEAALSVIKTNGFQRNPPDPRHFVRQMDKDLSLVLNAYPLPVFVIAPAGKLDLFKAISINQSAVIAQVAMEKEGSESAILRQISPFLENWDSVRQQKIIQDLEKAAAHQKLVHGLQEVAAAATYEKNQLLVVEKGVTRPVAGTGAVDKPGGFYVNDEIDAVIEKVLDRGNDAELVEDNSISMYQRIALIQSE